MRPVTLRRGKLAKPPASISLAEGFGDILCCGIVHLDGYDAMALELIYFSTEISAAVRVEDRSSELLLNLIFDECSGAAVTDMEAGLTSGEFV